MDEPATIPIRDLRKTAAEYRRKADEIDAHIDALLALVGIAALPPKPGAIGNIRTDAPQRLDGKRPKPPGIVTSKWAEVLTHLAAKVQDRPFSSDRVIEAARETMGRVMRTADVRRQFEPYLAVGYFIQPSPGAYQFTPDGFAKIGFEPNENLNLEPEAPKENEPAPAPYRPWGAGSEVRSATGWPSQS